MTFIHPLYPIHNLAANPLLDGLQTPPGTGRTSPLGAASPEKASPPPHSSRESPLFVREARLNHRD